MSYAIKENKDAGTGTGARRRKERADAVTAGNRNEKAARRSAVLSRMPNGDPPSVMLWGCEDD
ncbi:MAG: hypothetical protein ACOC6C_02215 [Verrucomicrobiota bacterium]